MKIKMILCTIAVSLLVGCSSEVPKDKVMTEKKPEISQEVRDTLISEDEAKKLTIEAFKKYIGVDIIEKNKGKGFEFKAKLDDNLKMGKENQDIPRIDGDYLWDVCWVDPKYDARVDQCIINAKTKDVEYIYFMDTDLFGEALKDEKITGISRELSDYRKVAEDFITKFDLTNGAKYEFVTYYASNVAVLTYKYDKCSEIEVLVDVLSNKICGFKKAYNPWWDFSYDGSDANMKGTIGFSKDELYDMAKADMKKYFDIDLDTKQLQTDVSYYNREKEPFIRASYNDFNVGPISYKDNIEDETISAPVSYDYSILPDGSLSFIGYTNHRDFNQKNMDVKKAEKIATDFMIQKGLINEGDVVEFVKQKYGPTYGMTNFKVKGDACKVTNIGINNNTEKVTGFGID